MESFVNEAHTCDKCEIKCKIYAYKMEIIENKNKKESFCEDCLYKIYGIMGKMRNIECNNNLCGRKLYYDWYGNECILNEGKKGKCCETMNLLREKLKQPIKK